MFFAQLLYAQETFIGATEKSLEQKTNIINKQVFYKIPKNEKNKVFRKTVKCHIVKNKGIQNFYLVSDIEKKWLNKILE